MKIQDMLTLYDYNYWANGRILTASAKVTLEQFLAPAADSRGGLRGTLVHILDAELGWRTRCQHNVWGPDLIEAEFPTLDVLKQQWRDEETAMRDYLAGLQDDDMTSLVRYTTDSGQLRERVLWHILLHVMNHGTQHRSEAAALLTRYGQSPGDVDFTLFLHERR